MYKNQIQIRFFKDEFYILINPTYQIIQAILKILQ
jgi:hypothetical protein